MTDYAMTGKKGTGKSKNSVRLMRNRYLYHGKRVATNLDVNLSAMFGPLSKKTYVRVPDRPRAFDLLAAGHGNPDSYEEDDNGGLFLDEMATWLNTRTFADKERATLLDFFAHARKHGWDTYYIMQNIVQVDKQLRESFIEQTVRHVRFDKVRIPFIGGLLSILFGEKAGYMPRFHVATARMGTSPQELVADRMHFTGKDIEKCYDTRQVFREDYPHGTHTVLSPWHVEGRYLPQARPSWFRRFWSGLWAKPSAVAAEPVRPVTVPDVAWVRVRNLCANLQPADALRVMARYSRARSGAPVGMR